MELVWVQHPHRLLSGRQPGILLLGVRVGVPAEVRVDDVVHPLDLSWRRLVVLFWMVFRVERSLWLLIVPKIDLTLFLVLLKVVDVRLDVLAAHRLMLFTFSMLVLQSTLTPPSLILVDILGDQGGRKPAWNLDGLKIF